LKYTHIFKLEMCSCSTKFKQA